jgi:hypothetical protein
LFPSSPSLKEEAMFAEKKTPTVAMVLVLAMAILIAGSGAAAAATAAPPIQSAAPPSTTIPYAGQLNNAAGNQVADGFYDFGFSLYDAPEGGNLLWTGTQSGVKVQGGSFSVSLGSGAGLPKAVLDRKECWLAVSVRGPGEARFTALSPRQLLSTDTPASVTALSCPHSHFTDYWGGTVSYYGLEVDNGAGTGDGVRGYSGSTAYNYAGLYGVGGGGTTAGSGGSGVYGSSYYGYGGYFESTNYRALYAKGNVAWYAGYIENPSGSTSVGLYVNGSMWVTGSKTGFVTDAALNDGPEPLETGDVVVITGAAAPLAGEIPVIRVRKASAAAGTAVAGVVDQGVAMQKGPQDEKAIPGVVGHEAHLADKTAIQPGEYLLIVTMGAYKGVKADATLAPIHAGDLLVASVSTNTAGFAASYSSVDLAGSTAVSAAVLSNSVIGKALGELNSGTGLIPVIVTLK